MTTYTTPGPITEQERRPANSISPERVILVRKFGPRSIEVRVSGPTRQAKQGSINWSAWGDQHPEVAVGYAEMLMHAAVLAPTLARAGAVR